MVVSKGSANLGRGMGESGGEGRGARVRTLVKYRMHVSPSVQKIALQFKAQLDNITGLRPEGEDFRWYLKVHIELQPHWRRGVSCVHV